MPGGLIGTRASAKRPPPMATQREVASRSSTMRSERKNTGLDRVEAEPVRVTESVAEGRPHD